MINVLDISRRFTDQWVVLDRRLKVVDSGNDLAALAKKHGGGRMTFYYASKP